MSKHNQYHSRYFKETHGKSLFDGQPTLVINRYRVPKPYKDSVDKVITSYKNNIPFNKAVDYVASLDPEHINRNKLAEHTLKAIANDY